MTDMTFYPLCPWHIQVGELFIAPGRIPNTGTLWIGKVEGNEGVEFDAIELAPVLLEFYNKNRPTN